MKANSLSSKGLSLSQASSISNLCNQRCVEINAKLSNINNCEKSVRIDGVSHVISKGNKLPSDVVELILNKAALHACQAFLMENIKAKDSMLKDLKRQVADISSVNFPERPKVYSPLLQMLTEVGEEWGWEKLSIAETNEFIEAEAKAAHVGQFIHDNSILSNLRKSLPLIPAIEWMEIETGKKSPVNINVHHTSEQLMKIHEELAKIHREAEQRVNYFKAKVKNLVTLENSRIAKINSDLQNEAAKINNDANAAYETAYKAATENLRSIQAEFEKTRQENIKVVAAKRIEVDPRFQKTVDTLLSELPDSDSTI